MVALFASLAPGMDLDVEEVVVRLDVRVGLFRSHGERAGATHTPGSFSAHAPSERLPVSTLCGTVRRSNITTGGTDARGGVERKGMIAAKATPAASTSARPPSPRASRRTVRLIYSSLPCNPVSSSLLTPRAKPSVPFLSEPPCALVALPATTSP